MEKNITVEGTKESDSRFRSIFENSMDAILLTIPSTGTIVMANPAACQLFDLTEEELKKLGRDGVTIMTNQAREVLSKKGKLGNIHAELIYKRKNGTTFVGEVASSSFMDADGTIKTSLIIRDITDRKKAEEVLIEKGERLELAQRIARLGSWDYYVKEDRAVWSKELFHIFALNPQKEAPNIAEYSKLIYPDDLKRVAEANQRLIAIGKLGEPLSFDYRIVHPDGTLSDLHSERMVQEVDEYGKPTRIVGIEQDITERKKLEAELSNSALKYSQLFNNTSDGVWINDLKGEIIEVNSAYIRMSGYSKEEIIGMPISKFECREKPEDITNHIKKVLKMGGHDRFESLHCRKDGSSFDVDITALYLPETQAGKLAIFIRDITEGKKMQAALEEYAKDLERLIEERTRQLKEKERMAAIGETAGMVGHDIRNPLQAIVSELYLAKRVMAEAKEQDTKEVLESINMIQEQVDYISKIVSDLQDFARPLRPEYTDIDLSDLIVKVFETVLVPAQIKLSIDIKGTLWVKSDPTFIKRALTNLTNNAIQAMPDGGELKLTAGKNESGVTITVSDTGKGIPENVKPNLFKPLMTTKAKGQGLGLAVVKRLMEGMNGKVSFDSEEGKGTTFIIELPIIK